MGLLHSRSRSQWRLMMLVNACPDDIFWPTEHFVTKPGMVMQHDEPECHAEKLVHRLQCQGCSEALCNQNMTLSAVSSKLLVSLQPNLVWWYSIISWSVLWKNGITAFKVKVIAKVKNVSECLSRWYFLKHRTFCYHIWYGDAVSWARVSCRHFHCCCYLQGHGHSKGSCDQNMTLSTTFSELLISLQPNLVWWYIIISENVLWKKLDYCIQDQGHSRGLKC